MGNGVAMATERSTHDVKAQRGLGRGRRREEEKRKKSICGYSYLVCWRNEKQGKCKGAGTWQPRSANSALAGRGGAEEGGCRTMPRSSSSVWLQLCTAPGRTDRKAIGKAVTLAFQPPQLSATSKGSQRCAISLNVRINKRWS